MTEHELDKLLRDYGGAVRAVCRAILPGHPQDAEEAEADTFYKLWRAPLTATVPCCAGARHCRWTTAMTPSWL